MRHQLIRFMLVPLALLLAATSPTQRIYVFDTGGSNASAKVGFLGVGSRTAQFPTMSGTVTLDSVRPGATQIDVTLDARAMKAPDTVTLQRLRGEKFFWVAKYPSVRFVGQRISMHSDRRGTVQGQLTARGVTKPMTLEVTFDQNPHQAAPGTPISLTGNGLINRRDFGMTAYSLIVGKEVTIQIKAKLNPRG